MATKKELQILLTARDEASKQFKKLDKEITKVQKSTGTTSKNFDKMGKASSNLTKSLLATAGGLFAISKVVGFVKDATKKFLDFEASMRNANTIMNLNEKQFKAISKEVLSLSKIVPIAAFELSEGLFKVASAGISAQNQIAFLGVASQLAVAGATDLNTAISGLVSVIKGFSLAESDATKIAGLFSAANEKGITTIGDMAAAIQKMTSAALKSNLSIEQTMTFLGTFTGITGNASEVATQFVAAVDAMAAPSVRASKFIKELNEKLGEGAIKFGKGAFESENFAEKSRKLWQALNQDAEALRKVIPSTEAASLVIAAATTQFDKFNMLLDDMSDESGNIAKFGRMFEENMKAQKNQLKLAASEWDFFKIKVGGVTSTLTLRVAEFANSIVSAFVFIKDGIRNAMKAMALIIVLAFEGAILIVKNSINSLIESMNKYLGTSIEWRADTTLNIKEIEELANEIDSLGKSINDNNKNLLEASNESKEFAKFKEDEAKLMADLEQLSKDEAKAKAEATEASKELTEANKKLSGSFSDLKKEGSDALKELAFEHSKSMLKIQNNVIKTKNSLVELEKAFEAAQIASQEGFKEQRKADVQGVAETIVAEEERAAELRQDIAKETNFIKKRLLEEELAVIEKSLEDNASFIKGIEDAIAEVKRINSLSNIDRAIEEFKAKRRLAEKEFDTNRILAQAEFNAKNKELQAELDAFNNKLEEEKKLFEEKTDFISKTLEEAEKFRQIQLVNTFNATKELVEKEIELFKELAKAIKEAQSAKASQFIPSASVTPFANGGIVTSPTIGLIGEDGPEAIIPLGKGGGGLVKNIINITGTFLSETAAEEIGDMIISRLKENVRL